jgi:hypothetical protein
MVEHTRVLHTPLVLLILHYIPLWVLAYFEKFLQSSRFCTFMEGTLLCIYSKNIYHLVRLHNYFLIKHNKH